jgi:hypothetical protein
MQITGMWTNAAISTAECFKITEGTITVPELIEIVNRLLKQNSAKIERDDERLQLLSKFFERERDLQGRFV